MRAIVDDVYLRGLIARQKAKMQLRPILIYMRNWNFLLRNFLDQSVFPKRRPGFGYACLGVGRTKRQYHKGSY